MQNSHSATLLLYCHIFHHIMAVLYIHHYTRCGIITTSPISMNCAVLVAKSAKSFKYNMMYNKKTFRRPGIEPGTNRSLLALQSAALPTELPPVKILSCTHYHNIVIFLHKYINIKCIHFHTSNTTYKHYYTTSINTQHHHILALSFS